MGCCLFAAAGFLGPRIVLFLIWLFGDRLAYTFESFWMGFAGFLVLPWTTLFYALAYHPVLGVTGIGWLFVALGFVFDISTWTGGDRSRRNRAQV